MNLRAGFEDALPGRAVARLVLVDRRRVTVVWTLPLPAGTSAAGRVSKRLLIYSSEPASGRSAA
jgi:hypothetical protein